VRVSLYQGIQNLHRNFRRGKDAARGHEVLRRVRDGLRLRQVGSCWGLWRRWQLVEACAKDARALAGRSKADARRWALSLMRKVAARVLSGRLCGAVRRWRDGHGAELSREKGEASMKRVGLRMAQAAVARGWSQWIHAVKASAELNLAALRLHSTASETSRGLAMVLNSIKRMSHRALANAFVSCRQGLADAKARVRGMAIMRRVSVRWVHHDVVKAVLTWRGSRLSAVKRERGINGLKRVGGRLRHREASMALAEWRGNLQRGLNGVLFIELHSLRKLVAEGKARQRAGGSKRLLRAAWRLQTQAALACLSQWRRNRAVGVALTWRCRVAECEREVLHLQEETDAQRRRADNSLEELITVKQYAEDLLPSWHTKVKRLAKQNAHLEARLAEMQKMGAASIHQMEEACDQICEKAFQSADAASEEAYERQRQVGGLIKRQKAEILTLKQDNRKLQGEAEGYEQKVHVMQAVGRLSESKTLGERRARSKSMSPYDNNYVMGNNQRRIETEEGPVVDFSYARSLNEGGNKWS